MDSHVLINKFKVGDLVFPSIHYSGLARELYYGGVIVSTNPIVVLVYCAGKYLGLPRRDIRHI